MKNNQNVQCTIVWYYVRGVIEGYNKIRYTDKHNDSKRKENN